MSATHCPLLIEMHACMLHRQHSTLAMQCLQEREDIQTRGWLDLSACMKQLCVEQAGAEHPADQPSRFPSKPKPA